MTVTAHATDITAPDADLLAAITAYLADNEPNVVAGQVLGAVDGVTGDPNIADIGNAEGAVDTTSWVLDAGQHDPGGGKIPLAVVVIDPGALTPTGGSSFTTGATLAVRLEADTVKGAQSGVIAFVVDTESLEVIDTAHLVPLAASGAATVSLAGLGHAAITALADEAATLAVGFVSVLDAGVESEYDIDAFTLTIPEAVGGPVSNNSHAESANCMVISVILDGACEIVEDAPVFVDTAWGKVTPTVRREDGVDYSAKNFGGVTCGPEMMGDTVEKGVDLEGEMCMVNWAFMALTTGNPAILNAGGHTIGYQQLRRLQNACDPTQRKPHMALTIIRAAATDDAGCIGAAESATGATTAVAHTYPNVADWVWDIPENSDQRAAVPFKCKGYTAPNPGRGPLNLYPAGATPERIDPDAFYVPYFVDPADLPTPDGNTFASHPAPLGKL